MNLTELLQGVGLQWRRSIAQNPVARITAVGETTVNCVPVVQKVVEGADPVDLPELVSVPVIFLHGGASYTAHPIAVGDYCLLLISERAIDRWLNGDDGVPPVETRSHDYSDAFALVGIYNSAGAVTIPAQITRVGDCLLQGNRDHEGDTTQTGNFTIEGDTTQTGNFTIEGDTTQTGDLGVDGSLDAQSYSVGGESGWTGAFPTGTGLTVTVVSGLITRVV